MNSATIMGRLGQDPKLHHFSANNCVLNLSVAVDQRKKVDGQWQTVAQWWRVAMFGERGAALAKLLKKGSRVFCAGEVGLREFEGRDGVKRVDLELRADRVEPLFDKREAGAGAGPSTGPFDEQDEIPF